MWKFEKVKTDFMHSFGIARRICVLCWSLCRCWIFCVCSPLHFHIKIRKRWLNANFLYAHNASGTHTHTHTLDPADIPVNFPRMRKKKKMRTKMIKSKWNEFWIMQSLLKCWKMHSLLPFDSVTNEGLSAHCAMLVQNRDVACEREWGRVKRQRCGEKLIQVFLIMCDAHIHNSFARV